jgi:hypothetical protein
LESLCEDCQTVAWLGVTDIPGLVPSCEPRLPLASSTAVQELQVALVDGDAMADCLVSALAVVDTAVVREELGAAVLMLEVQGRCRPRVAAAVLLDLGGLTPSGLDACGHAQGGRRRRRGDASAAGMVPRSQPAVPTAQ